MLFFGGGFLFCGIILAFNCSVNYFIMIEMATTKAAVASSDVIIILRVLENMLLIAEIYFHLKKIKIK